MEIEVLKEKGYIISILNHDWEIVFTESNNSIFRETSGTILRGKCDSLNRIIFISTNQKEIVIGETLIHELTHAIIMELMLNKDEFSQEEVCMFMESYAKFIVDLANEYAKEGNLKCQE